MSNDTTLLLGLEGLACQRVEVDGQGRLVARLVTEDAAAAACPGCGQMSHSPKGYVTTTPRDLPHGGRGVALMWCKRRWRCKNPDCRRGSFTESVAQVPPRHRLTARLRAAAGAQVADAGATVEQAGRDHGLSWPTVHAAVLDHAKQVLPERLAPVRVLGIDETRRGRRRYTRNPQTGTWDKIADAWHVGFVDISGGQGLLGQAEGRTRAAVIDWLAAQPQPWRDQIQYVAIDMCSIFASAIAEALPQATLIVDHFHVVQLANQVIGEVRRRTTRALRGRRGRAGDGEWEVRNLLTRNMEDLSQRRFARMWNTLVELGDPGYDILAAYQAKELLRELLALAYDDPSRHRIAARLHAFYDCCAGSELPELHRLASTIERWWPAIEAFIQTGITNAKSEGLNRVAKLAARNAYGFRNPANQRIRVRCATTRRARGHLSTRRTSRTYRTRQPASAQQTSTPPTTASYTTAKDTPSRPPPATSPAHAPDRPDRLEPG